MTSMPKDLQTDSGNDAVTESERVMLEQFIFMEARLADESRYEDWESLLAEDVRYWVPINGEAANPDLDVSIINDNRSRLATRLRQLKTGTRHSQAPLSIMRRLLSNLEYSKLQNNEFGVAANFVVYEYQTQSINQLTLWPGRVEYLLRDGPAGLRMFMKKVMLVNASGPIPSLSFLI
ncbi:aromatic-ring-hydroxylating dioxygenase subunit beta [Paraburkholderia caribensis]|uniref:aromatic-ring-hydroxylating dioxygenase subunit beta n=1 Tax=Paraburkholderia caribensis TaxID=75105 RepID=UPI001CAE99C9|nr:aromatic-ring-hydroxylating dioxygenase subunit beta [Paraburkholderia caribensis]CAG9263077.1 Small subunit of phenylpropionate dioxygenase [Paraburkholderia caribensis]